MTLQFKSFAPKDIKTSDLVDPSFSTVVVATAAQWKKLGSSIVRPFHHGFEKRLIAQLKRDEDFLKAGCLQRIEGDDAAARLLLWSLPEDSDAFTLLEAARHVCAEAIGYKTRSLNLVVEPIDEAIERVVLDALGSALAVRIFQMPAFGKKAKERKAYQLKQVLVASDLKAEHGIQVLERGYLLGEGTNLARYLTTLPPNILRPSSYAKEVTSLSKEYGLKFKLHTKEQLKKMGAGAFTAVDQGDPDSKGGIFEISYHPKGLKAGAKPVVVVGKGLCFDTGGYDVKINSGMMTMKGDMQGSAVALACIVTAARLKIKTPMKAYLGVTENHLSPAAYKADEVITALNGLTIEVINTDAEGRLVLADTLTLATKDKPLAAVDFATLTGSAVRSLGTKYSAGFTNKKEWHAKIVDAGEESGERVWTFPLSKGFMKPLESKIADTLQCLRGPGPDHIYAAAFLSKFVQDGVPWVHVDLSASENEGGLAHVDSMFTGFGVRWFFSFLEKIQ